MVGIPVVRRLRQWWQDVGPGFNRVVVDGPWLRLTEIEAMAVTEPSAR